MNIVNYDVCSSFTTITYVLSDEGGVRALNHVRSSIDFPDTNCQTTYHSQSWDFTLFSFDNINKNNLTFLCNFFLSH